MCSDVLRGGDARLGTTIRIGVGSNDRPLLYEASVAVNKLEQPRDRGAKLTRQGAVGSDSGSHP
jgi:soluble P-type ATPase